MVIKAIKIYGYTLNKSLMAEDPDVKRAFGGLSGWKRHVHIFSDPARINAYAKKHPEGMIIAGAGVIFLMNLFC